MRTRVHACVCVRVCVRIQIKALHSGMQADSPSTPEIHKVIHDLFGFQIKFFLPCLGNKITLTKYIQEPIERFWVPIPETPSFGIDLVHRNCWYNGLISVRV